MRLYLDTNVVMDFLLGRHDPSLKLMDDVTACMHDILLSDHTLQELHRNDLDGETFVLALRACGKLHTCVTTDEDKTKATTIVDVYKTHQADALHAVLAARRKADVLVTRNIRDFPHVDIEVRRPDDF